MIQQLNHTLLTLLLRKRTSDDSGTGESPPEEFRDGSAAGATSHITRHVKRTNLITSPYVKSEKHTRHVMPQHEQT